MIGLNKTPSLGSIGGLLAGVLLFVFAGYLVSQTEIGRRVTGLAAPGRIAA